MTIRKFEDIQAWQQARILVKDIYALTCHGGFATDFGMRDQIRRAAVSVMANIAEGFDCESNTEFARFLGIARRSAVEVQSLLYAALDVHHLNEDDFKKHDDQAGKTKAMISAFESAMLRRSETHSAPRT